MKIELARLNHILIPKGKEGRERWRRSLLGRAVRPFFLLFWGALSDEGRMLLLTAFVVGALSADVRATTGYVFFSVVTGVLAGSLVASRTLRIRDVSVVVDAPRRVTIGEPVTFTVVCKRAPSKGEPPSPPQPLRIRGPFLPWDGRWLDEPPPEIVVPSHAEGRASTTMRARFIARGLHVLDSFTAAAVVPGGLACGTRESSDEVKLHVVPRVAKVMRLPFVIASRHQPGGVALASKSGEAMDLLGVRPYRAGDPVRDLHARSWARTGIPVVREYQQEYFTRVGVVLDTDVADEGRLEAAIELAAGVIAHLAHGETLIDVLVVGDRVHELTLGRSLGSLDQALELLASVERGPKLRAADLLRRLDPYVARLSSVIVIALADDDERKAVERGIAGKGIAAKTLLVDAALEKDIRARKELAFE